MDAARSVKSCASRSGIDQEMYTHALSAALLGLNNLVSRCTVGRTHSNSGRWSSPGADSLAQRARMLRASFTYPEICQSVCSATSERTRGSLVANRRKTKIWLQMIVYRLRVNCTCRVTLFTGLLFRAESMPCVSIATVAGSFL